MEPRLWLRATSRRLLPSPVLPTIAQTSLSGVTDQQIRKAAKGERTEAISRHGNIDLFAAVGQPGTASGAHGTVVARTTPLAVTGWDQTN